MSIKIAHLSDSHFDERGRLQDVIDVHRAFLDQAAEAAVDLIVHAGDWFERRSTPAERNAVADFILDASAVAPLFGVKGNHDVDLDLDLFPRLGPAIHPVFIADRPTAAPGSSTVLSLPPYYRVGAPGQHSRAELGLLALPWFDKAHLVAGLDATIDADATRERTIAAATDLLTCLRAEASRLRKEGIVPILVGHVLAAGSETSTGQVLIGTTVELAPGEINDVGCAYAALGHIHKAQEWYGGRVAYSGSPHRCNFGEPEAKGWRLVTLTDEGEFVSNEFRELPARAIVLLEREFVAGEPFDLGPDEAITGGLVRFRYHVRAEDLHLIEEDAIEAELRHRGAAEVQIEAVVETQTRVRASRIQQAVSTSGKVLAYLEAKGIDVDQPTWDRLETKLGSIEAPQ